MRFDGAGNQGREDDDGQPSGAYLGPVVRLPVSVCAHFQTSEGPMLLPSPRDLLLAGQVQRGIMPAVPQLPGYEFFAHYQPLYPVGGDYYDFVRLADDRLAIAVGDVAGKGLSAALMMAQFAAETRHR